MSSRKIRELYAKLREAEISLKTTKLLIGGMYFRSEIAELKAEIENAQIQGTTYKS